MKIASTVVFPGGCLYLDGGSKVHSTQSQCDRFPCLLFPGAFLEARFLQNVFSGLLNQLFPIHMCRVDSMSA